jgi:hypothetical protein
MQLLQRSSFDIVNFSSPDAGDYVIVTSNPVLVVLTVGNRKCRSLALLFRVASVLPNLRVHRAPNPLKHRVLLRKSRPALKRRLFLSVTDPPTSQPPAPIRCQPTTMTRRLRSLFGHDLAVYNVHNYTKTSRKFDPTLFVSRTFTDRSAI